MTNTYQYYSVLNTYQYSIHPSNIKLINLHTSRIHTVSSILIQKMIIPPKKKCLFSQGKTMPTMLTFWSCSTITARFWRTLGRFGDVSCGRSRSSRTHRHSCIAAISQRLREVSCGGRGETCHWIAVKMEQIHETRTTSHAWNSYSHGIRYLHCGAGFCPWSVGSDLRE